ncbi:DUF1918 domain-containing protein [soil metagenome]
MHAHKGDWLVIKGRTNDQKDERAEILEVKSNDGTPPYVVRWLRNDHETLIFPGSDAMVVTAAEHAAEVDRTNARLGRLQSTLAARRSQ